MTYHYLMGKRYSMNYFMKKIKAKLKHYFLSISMNSCSSFWVFQSPFH